MLQLFITKGLNQYAESWFFPDRLAVSQLHKKKDEGISADRLLNRETLRFGVYIARNMKGLTTIVSYKSSPVTTRQSESVSCLAYTTSNNIHVCCMFLFVPFNDTHLMFFCLYVLLPWHPASSVFQSFAREIFHIMQKIIENRLMN